MRRLCTGNGGYIVWCNCNMVSSLHNSHERHPISCSWCLGFLFWVESLIYVLPQSLQSCIGLWGFPGMIYCWLCCIDSVLFYSPWLVDQFPCTLHKPLSRWTSNLACEFTCVSQVWLTFGYTSLIPCHFLASDWWSSFCTFHDKLLLGLTWNHSISQPLVHLSFARAIELIAHPKITHILPFSWGISSKKAFCTL